jgi:hypothetical protein
MVKKKIYENKKLVYELRFTGKERDRERVTLVRAGDSWTPEYKGRSVCGVVSDGNGLDVTIHRQIGEDPTKLRLDFAEASDLGILLQEYTKSDPHAHNPLYEVKGTQELREERLAAEKKALDELTSGTALSIQNTQARDMMNSIASTPISPVKYCATCGAVCSESTGYGLFDTETGVQFNWPIYKCPNDAWYKFWHPIEVRPDFL